MTSFGLLLWLGASAAQSPAADSLRVLAARLPMRAKLAIAEFARILDESTSGATNAASSPSAVTKPRKARATVASE